MGRFNLIEEAWIKVINLNGDNEMVSIREVFKNANQFQALAGDTRTQDFAVLRILLAVLQTVFERYDLEGNLRELPDDEWEDEDVDDYVDQVLNDWRCLFSGTEFPSILFKYLDQWYDRFNLFDETYPFMQVTEKEIALAGKSSKDRNFFAKNMNRLISESGNKKSLFSPKSDDTKELLTEDELARWGSVK